MAKLNKEAVGQYNYILADDAIKTNSRSMKHNRAANGDASVDLVVKHPKHLQLVKLEPPKLFETNYHSDFRPPPQENLAISKIDESKKYTVYSGRPKLKSASCAMDLPRANPRLEKIKGIDQAVTEKNRILKSLLGRKKTDIPPRAQTADPAVCKSKPRWEESRDAANFQRDIVKGRPDWKHKEVKSYDVLNPEQPDQKRETKPYGAPMENMQENIAQKFMDEDDMSERTFSSLSTTSKLHFVDSRPQSMMTISRATGRSNSSASFQMHSRPYTVGDEDNNKLPTIQEEVDENEAISPTRMQERQTMSRFPQTKGKVRISRGLNKVKAKQVNLFEKKAPDKRFYRPSKVRQTPNEMNHYKKMRNRIFFKPLEQAIHEKDATDHEVKYQPERQLLKDARWKIRQDLKDVRTKNINSLVDRFAQRAELKKEEKRGRLGLPTYAERDPVSIYKLQNTITNGTNKQSTTDIKVTLPPRRRITPSIGSVQRARNLSTYANVWNQPQAPPYWGPQKVDHGLYLPPMAAKT